jgi:hypothetical protein
MPPRKLAMQCLNYSVTVSFLTSVLTAMSKTHVMTEAWERSSVLMIVARETKILLLDIPDRVSTSLPAHYRLTIVMREILPVLDMMMAVAVAAPLAVIVIYLLTRGAMTADLAVELMTGGRTTMIVTIGETSRIGRNVRLRLGVRIEDVLSIRILEVEAVVPEGAVISKATWIRDPIRAPLDPELPMANHTRMSGALKGVEKVVSDTAPIVECSFCKAKTCSCIALVADEVMDESMPSENETSISISVVRVV